MPGQRLTNEIKLIRDPGTTDANVGHIIDFNGPQLTNDRIEVTDGDSPSGGKEYLPARADPGPLQLTMNLDPEAAEHKALYTAATASPPTVETYRLQFSSQVDDYFEGPAFVGGLTPSGNSRGQALQVATTLQPTAVWPMTGAP